MGAAAKGVLLDLGGVVYVGEEPLPGAKEALGRLKDAGLPLRYLTNTTRKPRRALLEMLENIGLPVEREELFMPAIAARALLEEKKLSPHLLVHPALEEDFTGLEGGEGTALVVGDAAEGFTYRAMNDAFRVLEEGAGFYALAKNRSFQDKDGARSLDTGAFVAALEYASQREATVLGKPAAAFFHAAVDSLGCAAEETVMVGDDVEADVGGAKDAGLTGVLVRTGKYKDGDEERISPPPDHVAADLSAAADWILGEG
jgi:HAD superfamily hydrolase (TIGR01458 family)